MERRVYRLRVINHPDTPIFYNPPEWDKEIQIRKDTGLYHYLAEKKVLEHDKCTLSMILQEIYADIVKFDLTDKTNCEIIHCNYYMEAVLRVRSCAFSQVIDLLNYAFVGEERTNFFAITERYFRTSFRTLTEYSKTERLNKQLVDYKLRYVYLDPRCNEFIFHSEHTSANGVIIVAHIVEILSRFIGHIIKHLDTY